MATSLHTSYRTPVVSGNIGPSRARVQLNFSAAPERSCFLAPRLGNHQSHVTIRRSPMAYFQAAPGRSYRNAARLFSSAARAFRSPDPQAPRSRPTFAPLRKHSPDEISLSLKDVSKGNPQELVAEDKASTASSARKAESKDGGSENGSQEEFRREGVNERSQQGVEIAGNGRPPVADVLARMRAVLNKTKGIGTEAANNRQVHSSSQGLQEVSKPGLKEGLTEGPPEGLREGSNMGLRPGLTDRHGLEGKALLQVSASRHAHADTLAAEFPAERFVLDEDLSGSSHYDSVPHWKSSAEGSTAETFGVNEASTEVGQSQTRAPQDRVTNGHRSAARELRRFPPLRSAGPVTAKPELDASQSEPKKSLETRRMLPPLKPRSRGLLVRKGSEPGAEQAESGARLGGRADFHQDHQRSSSASGATAVDRNGKTVRLSGLESRGLGESVRGVNASVSGQTNGHRLFEPQLRERHVEAGGPLTEWLRAAAPAEPLMEREDDLQPLVVPEPEAATKESEDLAAELGERLSLGAASPAVAPLTEWAVTVPAPEEDSVTVSSWEEALETRAGQTLDGVPSGEGNLDRVGRAGQKGAEAADVTREDTEAAPLTEWLTQQGKSRAASGLEDALVSKPGAKLTEWREQDGAGRGSAGSQPILNNRNQRPDVLNPSPKPVLRPRPIVRNGRDLPPGVLTPASSNQTGDASLLEGLLGASNVSTSSSESDADAQRTPEWHALRRWRLTASAFGNAAGCWPDGRLRLWEEKLDLRPPFRGNAATAWGTKREAPAIDEYLRITGNSVAHQSFQIYKEHDEVYTWLGASPDGLIERDSAGLARGSGILEVKCPFGRGRPETAQPYNSVPFYYIPQVQGLMEIFDREWADVYVWTVNGSVVYRVERDPVYWALLFSVLSQFWWQHVIPAKHEMLQGRTDPAYLRQFEPQATDVRTGLILEESKRLSANSPAIWTDSGRVFNGRM